MLLLLLFFTYWTKCVLRGLVPLIGAGGLGWLTHWQTPYLSSDKLSAAVDDSNFYTQAIEYGNRQGNEWYICAFILIKEARFSTEVWFSAIQISLYNYCPRRHSRCRGQYIQRDCSVYGDTPQDSNPARMQNKRNWRVVSNQLWVGVNLSLAGAATSIIFVATKHVFCHDKSMLVATKLVARQNFCRDKHIFVVTKHLSRQTFVATNIILSRQKFCHYKLTFVTTNTSFVAIEVCLSRQNIWPNFCRDKRVCRDKTFVPTKIIVSRQT